MLFLLVGWEYQQDKAETYHLHADTKHHTWIRISSARTMIQCVPPLIQQQEYTRLGFVPTRSGSASQFCRKRKIEQKYRYSNVLSRIWLTWMQHTQFGSPFSVKLWGSYLPHCTFLLKETNIVCLSAPIANIRCLSPIPGWGFVSKTTMSKVVN